MKKTPLSIRSIRFIERNNLENEKVKNYVTSLIENVFKINEYCFKIHEVYGTCLCVNNYIFFLDKKYIELKLLKEEKVIKLFYGDSCWYQGLKYLKDNLL